MQETTNQSGYRRFASSVCVTSEFVTQHGKKTSFFHWEFELKTRQKINFLKYHIVRISASSNFDTASNTPNGEVCITHQYGYAAPTS